jgi:hypothetical protein
VLRDLLDLPEPPAFPPTPEGAAAFEREVKELLRRELPNVATWCELTELQLSSGLSREAYTDELITLIATAWLDLGLAHGEARRRAALRDLKQAHRHLEKAKVTGVKGAGNEDAAWELVRQAGTISTTVREMCGMLGAPSPRGRPRKLALEALVRGLPRIMRRYTGKPHHAESHKLLQSLVAPDLEYSSYLRLVRRHRQLS